MIRYIFLIGGTIIYAMQNVIAWLVRNYYKQLYRGILDIHPTIRLGKGIEIIIEKDAQSLILEKGVVFRKAAKLLVGRGGNINIGEGTYFNSNVSINAFESIDIGKNCLFGESVKIYDHNHVFKDTRRLIKDQGYNSSAITIGENVWIGSNTIILKGVTIGDNSVIGANCTISKNINPNTLILKKADNLQVEKINSK